jgi:magnesium transporter
VAHNKRKLGLVPSLPNALNPVHQMRVMGRLVRRRATRPGAPPGTLVPTGLPRIEKVRIQVLEYGADGFRDREVEKCSDALPFQDPPAITWLNVEGIHDVELVRELGERVGLHPLVLEDIVSVGQRPKIEEHPGYLFVVLPMLSFESGSNNVFEEQLSIVLGANYVFTFQERAGDGDPFDPVRERIRNAGARIRGQGPDYLVYALVDSVVDHYFLVLETLGAAAEQLELEVFQEPGRETMRRIHALKRELLVARRAVWPVRDMVNNLARTESELVSDATRVFLRDVHDHMIRIIDTVVVLRDVLGGALDLYLSTISNRTNEVMKILTMIATIFIPLTFLVGVYGMNFDFMPELRWAWAYPILMLLMLLLALGMVWQFKRKGWL